ncbi:hypothetical protein D3C78_1908120 [compost metagenome]
MTCAKRPNGMLLSAAALLAGSDHACSAMGVSVTVGFMLFTRMPCGPNSRHSARVTASIAAFEAL